MMTQEGDAVLKSGQASERFLALDGMRGVFALSVAMYHFYTGTWIFDQRWFANLFLLVDFFFVLSGFVIWNAYGSRISSAPAAVGFIVKRFGRLWPAHFAVLLAMVGLELIKLLISSMATTDTQAFTGNQNALSLGSSVLMIHALGLHDAPVWNVPSWSISVEFFAYLTFLAVALAPSAWQTLGVIAIVVMSLVAIVVSGQFLTGTTQYGFPRCLVGFGAGVLIAKVTAGTQQRFTGAYANTLELGCVLALAVVLANVASPAATLWALPVFVAGLGVFAHSDGIVSKMLRGSVFQYLGERSYCIYIVHYLVVLGLFRVGQVAEIATGAPVFVEAPWQGASATEIVWTLNTPNPLVDGLAYAVYGGLVVLVAELVYRLVDRPGRAWFRHFADRLVVRLQDRHSAQPVADAKQ